MKSFLFRHSLRTRGYTIVELAAVIAVIAILAGVSYFAIGSWRDRIADTEVRNDMINVTTAMKNARNWGDGYPVYPNGTVYDGTNSTKSVYTQGSNATLTYDHGDVSNFCIDGQSKVRPGVYYFVDTSTGSTELKKGTCAGGEGATPLVPGTVTWLVAKSTVSKWCSGPGIMGASDDWQKVVVSCGGSSYISSTDGGGSWGSGYTKSLGSYGYINGLWLDASGSTGYIGYGGSTSTSFCVYQWKSTYVSYSELPNSCYAGSDAPGPLAASGDGSVVLRWTGRNSGAGTVAQISRNSGSTWSSQRIFGGSGGDGQAMAISRDGTTCLAIGGVNSVGVSTDSCATWTEKYTFAYTYPRIAAISNDGTVMLIGSLNASSGGPLALSVNRGQNWSILSSAGSRTWLGGGVSGDGKRLFAYTSSTIYTSLDDGQTWQQATVPAGAGVIEAAKISNDGKSIGVLTYLSSNGNNSFYVTSLY